MVYRFYIRTIIKLITKEILNMRLLLMIVYTNSKLLYDCLVKLSNI